MSMATIMTLVEAIELENHSDTGPDDLAYRCSERRCSPQCQRLGQLRERE
jgi:hypothetical protein